ncbi:MAG TPA: histidine kinase [Solirubrobacteraceae bacterium]|nr:histidine kinase [Solirubrobacteraceae bacterium]
MRAKLWLLGLAGMAAGIAAVWLAAHGPSGRPTEPGPVLTLLVGASLLGSGLASWRARPENRLGPLMVATSFGWFAGLLTEAPGQALATIGTAIQYVWIAGFIVLILSFPSGRLERRVDRSLVAATLFLTTAFPIVAMLYGTGPGLRCPSCPHNPLDVFHDNTVSDHLLGLQRALGGVVIVIAMAVLARRWLRASAPRRREVTPVLVAGGATLVTLTATIVHDLVGDPLGSLPATIWFYTTATLPVAILAVFLRRRLARGGVAGLVVQLGESSGPAADLRDALSRALGDPSLELAFWYSAEDRYVSADGRPLALPGEPDTDRAATFVERDGQPIAVVLHDRALEHNAELVQSVCAAAGLALENERLHAELRARLAELQASRARLVEATDTERRRIERDLHDGTQQRLVSIAMSLGLLESRLPGEPGAAAPLVREAREALAAALQELRELTQGIHPPLLAERGLSAALEELCRRAPLPARAEIALERRFSDQIESAAYFFTSEALTNAAKHSHATEIAVTARCEGPTLVIEVADDGIGAAVIGGGSGLRGLADRVEALSGTMTLSSPPGRGTTLRAEIPCA